MAKNRKHNEDPLYSVLDAVFKGIGFLVMLPFKGFGNKGPNRDQLARVKREYMGHWLQIENQKLDPQGAKHAIMQADILLDKALEFNRIPGTSLGEKLKAATSKLSRETLNDAWEAHKVRNRLAHELNYHITESEARRVLAQFKSVLRSLGVL